jgi:hypothetical protein
VGKNALLEVLGRDEQRFAMAWQGNVDRLRQVWQKNKKKKKK